MHILLITHYFAPEDGAPQRRWAALIERFNARGHRVTVFAPPPHYPGGRVEAAHRQALKSGSRSVDADGNVVRRVQYLPHRGDLLTRTLDHLWAAVSSTVVASRRREAGAPDIVVATAPAIESLLAGQIIARRFGIPFVAEMRDAWPDLVAFTPGFEAESSPRAIGKRWVHRTVTSLQSRASLVITTTESFATVLRNRGIRHVEVVRNGTTHTTMPALPESSRQIGPLRVLYMGTIGRSQGLEIIVKAVAALRAEGVAVEARIVGQGADLARLDRLNREFGEPVELRNAVAPSEVRSHYEWADTTVVSLRNWEPFRWTVPSKLYELLATGRHITALVAGEAATIVKSTGAGSVVPPGDVTKLVEAWKRLSLDRPGLRVGAAGRAWAEAHADYGSLGDRYLSLLAGVLDTPRQSSHRHGKPRRASDRAR